jgi:hypothetical protein
MSSPPPPAAMAAKLTPDRIIRLTIYMLTVRWNKESGIELITDWGADEREALVRGILFDWSIPDMPAHIEACEPFELDCADWLRLKAMWPSIVTIPPDSSALCTLSVLVRKYSSMYN